MVDSCSGNKLTQQDGLSAFNEVSVTNGAWQPLISSAMLKYYTYFVTFVNRGQMLIAITMMYSYFICVGGIRARHLHRHKWLVYPGF